MTTEQEKSADEIIKEIEDNDFYELLKAMAIAAVIAIFIRTFLFEPFNIPSGSMFPTLKVGDYLFVEKYSYGYSQYSFPLGLIKFDGRVLERMPERGDVAVFRQPKKVHIDYIKRLIGLPGDKIQVKRGVLHINGAAVQREYVGTEGEVTEDRFVIYKKYLETLPNGVQHHIYEINDDMPLDNTEVFTVPEGYYFAMGDNRDGSLDSRVQEQVGFVPAQNLIGRAAILFYSIEDMGYECRRTGTLAAIRSLGCKLKTWPRLIRYNRIFNRVKTL